ncbi:hypothetical protein [Branchiibius sp. NY16-3462-2]|uniref:TA system antitoxin ParD family protein n=1 Tax=Branchiibius sp. NY16-3462-2 TaxID=1807500 RepID=UPI000797681C|nr:hypothetical protein [Branchiibius sp. NY16-3462-2]KYH43090.1 hypothetical protein AZH51_06480 [Branchiibius sp. NY16-3462-2]
MADVPTSIPNELFALAAAAGEQSSRTAAQQLAHWARIGRSIENSPDISPADIRAVLEGRARYDDLRTMEQVVVRATWEEGFAGAVEALDFAREFTQQGRQWSELDEEGNVVVHVPSHERAATTAE